MLEQFFQGFGMALRLDTFIMMSLGLFGGMLVGALPGFTTLMAMAILLPISFFLDPIVGIPFLLGDLQRRHIRRQHSSDLDLHAGHRRGGCDIADGYQINPTRQVAKST